MYICIYVYLCTYRAIFGYIGFIGGFASDIQYGSLNRPYTQNSVALMGLSIRLYIYIFILSTYERCPKPKNNTFISETKMLTVADVFQAFAYDMTLLLFLLTPACCSCCNYKDKQHQQRPQLTTLTATMFPQNCLRHLTKHNTLPTPNLVSESSCLF